MYALLRFKQVFSHRTSQSCPYADTWHYSISKMYISPETLFFFFPRLLLKTGLFGMTSPQATCSRWSLKIQSILICFWLSWDCYYFSPTLGSQNWTHIGLSEQLLFREPVLLHSVHKYTTMLLSLGLQLRDPSWATQIDPLPGKMPVSTAHILCITPGDL